MPETMIERVARAVGAHYDGSADPIETPNNWASALEAARAALTAMREPTEAMIEEGEVAMSEGRGGHPLEAKAAWLGMIDAALAEGKDD